LDGGEREREVACKLPRGRHHVCEAEVPEHML